MHREAGLGTCPKDWVWGREDLGMEFSNEEGTRTELREKAMKKLIRPWEKASPITLIQGVAGERQEVERWGRGQRAKQDKWGC